MQNSQLRFYFSLMQKADFSDCLDALVASDPRYEKEAYLFVRDALDYTLKQGQAAGPKGSKRSASTSVGGAAGRDEPERHVTGQQLVAGARALALAEWGPMAITVLAHWGIHSTADIGAIVYNLIEARIFGKNDQDSPADFEGAYSFHEAFVLPFQPAAPPGPGPAGNPSSARASGAAQPGSPIADT